MLDRRAFLASLFAPVLTRFKKRSRASDALAELDTMLERWSSAPLQTFVELPEGPITEAVVYANKLYALTPGGLYEVFGNGTYKRLDSELFATIPQFHSEVFALVIPRI